MESTNIRTPMTRNTHTSISTTTGTRTGQSMLTDTVTNINILTRTRMSMHTRTQTERRTIIHTANRSCPCMITIMQDMKAKCTSTPTDNQPF